LGKRKGEDAAALQREKEGAGVSRGREVKKKPPPQKKKKRERGT